MFRYEAFTQSEMENQVAKMKVLTTKYNHLRYEGFHYFNPENVFRSTWHRNHLPEDVFILAYYKNQIVGVCLVQKSPYDEQSWWISYTDVHEKYKRKGIATGLYAKLNEWVSPSMIIYGSSLSNEGQAANLYTIRQAKITRCLNFNTDNDYHLYLMKKAQ